MSAASGQPSDHEAADEYGTDRPAGDEHATGEPAGDEHATGEPAGDEHATDRAAGDEGRLEPRRRRSRREVALTGAGVALGLGVLWAVLAVPVGLHLGMIAVAVMAGWVVGAVVRRVAPGARLLAVDIALGAWLVSLVFAYFLSQLLLPEAATPLAERLSVEGLVEYTLGTFDLVHAAAVAIFVFISWRSAR